MCDFMVGHRRKLSYHHCYKKISSVFLLLILLRDSGSAPISHKYYCRKQTLIRQKNPTFNWNHLLHSYLKKKIGSLKGYLLEKFLNRCCD